jgi:hypothetical protein
VTRRFGSSFRSSISRTSLLPWRRRQRAALPVTPGATFSIALTNTSTDLLGVYAQQGSAIGFTVSNAGTASSQKWQSSTNGVTLAGDIGGATGTTFTPNIGTNVTDGHFIRAAVIVSGTEYYSVWRQVRQAAGSFAALTNQSFTDDTGPQTYTYAAATGTGLTWTYAPTGLFTGVTHDAGTRTFTFDTNALAVQSGTVLGVTATDQYGRAATGSPRTFTLGIAPPAAGSFGALANQSFAGNTGEKTYVFGAATGAGLTWSYGLSAAPAGVTIDSATRTITFNTDALAVQSGTVITVTATDQYARAATGSPRTFLLTITPAVNPELDPLTFNAGTQELTAPYTYAGPDTLIAIVALRSGGTANTGPNMVANTGTWIERGVVDPFSVDEFDLTGLFTAAADGANAVDVVIAEKNNGGVSNVETTAVSGLDLDPGTETLELTGGRTDGILITYTGTLTITGSRTDGLRIEAA